MQQHVVYVFIILFFSLAACTQQAPAIVVYNPNQQSHIDAGTSNTHSSADAKPDVYTDSDSYTNYATSESYAPAKSDTVSTSPLTPISTAPTEESSNPLPTPVSAPLKEPVSRPDTVTVKLGDTLYQISQTYEIAARDIIELNNLKAPYNLKNGQVLKLPDYQYHTVQPGDTLYRLSRRYNIDVATLTQMNDMGMGDPVVTGQKIRLPSNLSSSADNQTEVAASPTIPTETVSDSVTPQLKPQDGIPSPASAPAPALISSPEMPIPSAQLSSKYSTTSLTTSATSSQGFNWPVNGNVLSRFGPKQGGLYNDGINISAPRGSTIKAAADGTVVYAGDKLKGYGNLLLIKHPNGYITSYAHADKIIVTKGAVVQQGDIVGYVGKSGNVTSPQLHFSVRKGRKPVDPEKFLPELS